MNSRIFFLAMLSLLMLILTGCPEERDRTRSDAGNDIDAGADAEVDAEDTAEEPLVPTGDRCPCQWGGGESSGIPCAGCEGGRCWQSSDLAHPAYCTESCEENADCEVYGETWECAFRQCRDSSRETWWRD